VSAVNADDRDLAAEVRASEAGEVGIPVDAVCCGCQRVHVKRVTADSPEDASGSFRAACHRCQTVTWWNVVAVLKGLLRSDDDDCLPEWFNGGDGRSDYAQLAWSNFFGAEEVER
jgi:hypothetical protein